MRRVGPALTSVMLLIGLGGVATADGAAPPSGHINALLQPPYTYYTAVVTDPDGDELIFDWSGTSIGCGSWQASASGGETADWYHGADTGPLANNTGVACSHEGGTNSTTHPGTFWVTVRDSYGPGNSISCTFSGPGGPPGSTKQGPPCEPTRYDLGGTIEGPATVEVGVPTVFRVTVTNKGPSPASGIESRLEADAEGDPQAIAEELDPTGLQADRRIFALGPGTQVTYAVEMRFFSPADARQLLEVSLDLPPELNPNDNTAELAFTVSKPGCTQRARAQGDEGANVRNKTGRQVVCTTRADDRITAGDQDVVYSKGGDDHVTCKEFFCVLELGGGNDVAKCPAGCYVNGGPGKDKCLTDEERVILENCEKY